MKYMSCEREWKGKKKILRNMLWYKVECGFYDFDYFVYCLIFFLIWYSIFKNVI